MRIRVVLLSLVGLLLLASGLLTARQTHTTQSMVPAHAAAPMATATTTATTAEASPPWIAAHYFGRHWPKNFLNGYRRNEAAGDFRQLREEGFNTVILLVPWAELQPDISTCCRFDARAFARLRYLIDQADVAGLRVILRVGYYWSFAADGLDVRYQRLLNDSSLRPTWIAFLREVQTKLASRPAVVMSFMSWEDLPLQLIDPSARSLYNTYLQARQLPPLAAKKRLPKRENAGMERFLGYWDWLLVNRIVVPASRILPGVSFESRIDSDAVTETGAGGKPSTRWINHKSTYFISGARAAVFYWAPFWGADNRGELVQADRALQLLQQLLDVVAAQVHGQPLFIDQLNVVDNTAGFDHNARIDPQQIGRFLAQLPCTLKRNHVIGYGIWTERDYRESSIYNPSFAYGMEDWTFAHASSAGAAGLQAVPGGDNELHMHAGDLLTQIIPIGRGRNGLPYHTCVTAIAKAPSTLHVDIGAGETLLHFFHRGSQEVCAAVGMVPPSDAAVTLRLRLGSGDLAVRDVYLFDHIQRGDVRDTSGAGGSMLQSLRSTNLAMRDAKLRCPAR